MSNELTDILNSGDVESLVLTAASKAYKAGQLFYDPVTDSLTFHSSISGTALNIGQEAVIPVFNDTGATITDGKPCTNDGAYTTLGIPKTRLAQANTFTNAYVLGLATHDIPDQTVGLLTRFGKLNGIDTSGLTPDVPAYLSATVPGGWTSTPPDIISRLGGPLVIHATAGSFYALIDSTISVPPLFGILKTIPDAYDITTLYQNLVNYQIEDAVTIPVDKLNGTITIPNGGRYRGSFTVTMTVPSAASARTITIQAWNITQASEAIAIPISVAKDITEVGRSMAVPFTAVSGDVIVMRIKADTAISGASIDSVSYDLQSIHVV